MHVSHVAVPITGLSDIISASLSLPFHYSVFLHTLLEPVITLTFLTCVFKQTLCYQQKIPYECQPCTSISGLL